MGSWHFSAVIKEEKWKYFMWENRQDGKVFLNPECTAVGSTIQIYPQFHLKTVYVLYSVTEFSSLISTQVHTEVIYLRATDYTTQTEAL